MILMIDCSCTQGKSSVFNESRWHGYASHVENDHRRRPEVRSPLTPWSTIRGDAIQTTMPNWVSGDNANMKHISVSNWKATEAPVPLVESGDRGKRTWEEQ
jgi:hypothetical protein